MSEKKPFIVHAYREKRYLYSETFTSRKDMASHLRSLGVKLSNSDICNMNSASKTVCAGRFTYEIEELPYADKEIVHNGSMYIALSDYCRRTGSDKDKIRYLYHQGKIKGLTVGKKNYVYIFWESL